MSIEPNAGRRLRLVCATTRDPDLMIELRRVIEDDPMAFVPSADLLREIALCETCTQDAPRTARAGLCEPHRARWNLEACMAQASDSTDHGSLQGLMHGLFASPDVGAQLLSAFDRQRRALRLVLEAHSRGAVRLPDSIAETVERACSAGPRFLTGGPRSATPSAGPRLAERMHS